MADEPFAAPEIRRLDELRVEAAELAIGADLAAGRHHELADLAARRLREREEDGRGDVLGPVEARVGRRFVSAGPSVEEIRRHTARDEEGNADAAGGLGR